MHVDASSWLESPGSSQQMEPRQPPPRHNPVRLLRDPDHELVRRCQNPDHPEFEQAFEQLFDRYRDRVYSIAYRITGSANDALDVVQEAFALVFRKLATFRFDSQFSTWLFRLVVNCAIDLRRRERSAYRRRGQPLALLTPDHEPEDAGPRPAEQAADSELEDHVQQHINKLSTKLRAVVVLRYLEAMSYEELAATLGISLGTVKSRLARAHLALAQRLEMSLDRFGVAERYGRRHDPDAMGGSNPDGSTGEVAG